MRIAFSESNALPTSSAGRAGLAVVLLLLTACVTQPSSPQITPAPPNPPPSPPPSTMTARTAKLRKIDGYVPLYWDEEAGRLLMEISRLGEELIWHVSLPAGVGSNPIGLDRGAMA